MGRMAAHTGQEITYDHILNLDHDHFDCYPSTEELIDAFQGDGGAETTRPLGSSDITFGENEFEGPFGGQDALSTVSRRPMP